MTLGATRSAGKTKPDGLTQTLTQTLNVGLQVDRDVVHRLLDARDDALRRFVVVSKCNALPDGLRHPDFGEKLVGDIVIEDVLGPHQVREAGPPFQGSAGAGREPMLGWPRPDREDVVAVRCVSLG